LCRLLEVVAVAPTLLGVKLATLPQWASELVASGRVGRLGFADDSGLPRVLPITYAVVDGAVWSAIDLKPKSSDEPARVRWLRARPDAALVVDHYADDWGSLAWVQLLGRVEVVAVDEGSEGLAALTSKYPQYVAEPPPGPLLRLDVARALCWRASDG
jgi:PPOX class probable F420-dependent enzyme